MTHHSWSVIRRQTGAFSISAGGRETLRLDPAAGGWRVKGPDSIDGWTLERVGAEHARFMLMMADAETEAGRTSALPGMQSENVCRDLVMGDGRVYRMLLRGPEDPRYELLGWETSGAYLTGRSGPRGWSIVPEPASSGLDEIRPLLILFAAEILDAGLREKTSEGETTNTTP